MKENYLRVGVIANTHGVKGEVKVYPTTDDLNRFDLLKDVILDTGKEKLSLSIEGVKYFKNMAILKFKGYDNIDQIEKYKGMDLLVTRENAMPLEENEYYIVDLIDMEVFDENDNKLGVLTDVMQTGANDVYIIELKDGKELLLPNIDQCILNVDIEGRKMKVHVLEGLMD